MKCSLRANGTSYGEPIITEDGSTVIPVTRVRAGTSSPVGVFVVRDGGATWVPSIDINRVAQVGVATGFVAAALASLAVLRRPPWPHVTRSSTDIS
jgi:hypothetical protein